jgi:hypothetical protein
MHQSFAIFSPPLPRTCAAGVIRRLALLCCVATLAGCSPGGPALGKVSGRVTLDGQPVAKAAVTFVPQTGGRPAMAVTDDSGQYKLDSSTDKAGVPTGTYSVTVIKQESAGATADAGGLAGGAAAPGAAPRWIVPQRYSAADTSQLSAEVKPGDNTSDFALTTEPAGG